MLYKRFGCCKAFGIYLESNAWVESQLTCTCVVLPEILRFLSFMLSALGLVLRPENLGGSEGIQMN